MVFSPSSGSGFFVTRGGHAFCSSWCPSPGLWTMLLQRVHVPHSRLAEVSLRRDADSDFLFLHWLQSLDKSEAPLVTGAQGTGPSGGHRGWAWPQVARLLGHLSQCPRDQPGLGCHHRPPQVH